MSPRLRAVLILLPCLFAACGKSSGPDLSNTAVVALNGDVESFNPVVTRSMISSEINSLIYPQMFELTFNLSLGRLEYGPALVKRWEFLDNGLDIKLIIRNDVRWENGVLVSPQDIKFTYEMIGDPDVASPLGNYVDNMIFTNGRFDVDRSIEIVNDTTMIFHFASVYPQQLFHLTVSPIPKHIFKDADRKAFANHPANAKPVGAGPFKLEKWTRHQEIVVSANQKCTLPGPGLLERVIFRVIQEPTTRLTELKKGTIDLMWPVYYEDVKGLQEQYADIKLETLPPRVYEYIAWANVDFEEYKKSGGKTVRPHRLFGDARVRQALTYGINRKGILDAKLGPYGELAVSDFSPIFRWSMNTDLRPYPYDPQRGRQLLQSAGWSDSDGDGVLDKGGVKFEFSLYYGLGNARRAYAATVIQENLKQLGIVVHLTQLEPVVLYEKASSKDYDAFLGGFNVSLAIDPSNRWNDISDPYNSAGYHNDRVSELITLGLRAPNENEAARYWREIQSILHQDQPFTFMYWIKDVVAINRRLKGTKINTLGILDRIENWKIGDPKAYATF